MSTPIGSSQWMYATGAEVTQQSLKFNDDESQYLNWTPANAGNRKTWTWSAWVKRGNLGTRQAIFVSSNSGGNDYVSLEFTTGDILQAHGNNGSASVQFLLTTSAVFRDTSAWYHIVISFDTTQATSANRVKVYVNGVLQTFSSATYPPLNYDSRVNTTNQHNLGSFLPAAGLYLDGYLSDVYFIDGQALDPTSFGQFTNGYWEKKDYAGTYGTNGFHLTFQDDVVSEGFNTVTYRGTGAAQSISGLGFAPDLVWLKARSNLYHHGVFDVIRGGSAALYPSLTYAETTESGVTSFDGDGFSLGTSNGSNLNNAPFVAWAWDAGSGSPVSNTDGSITSTVKANPSYGFSIVTWTATTGTVGHGLGTAPELIIEKRRSSTSDWIVGTTAIDGSNDYLRLNTTVGKTDSASASPTATVFTPNTGSGDVVAYCFHSVAGYSSIGSFTGTGAAGNAVTTGFRPAWLLVKDTTSTGNWFIYDNTRSVDGTYGDYLRANLSDAEGNFDSLVATSTGFGTLGSSLNTSGNTFIYMAFADTREAAFWKDVSGQGNHWTPNNLDYRDSLIDSPANNFAVFNALAGGTRTLSEGNLKQYLTATSRGGPATFTVPQSGKWYWETMANDSNGNLGVGVSQDSQTFWTSFNAALNASYYANGEYKIESATQTSGFSAFSNGDILSLAVDADVSPPKIYFGYNGTWQNSADPAAGTGGFSLTSGKTYLPMMAHASGSSNSTATMNFGQDSTFAGTTTAGGNQDDNGIGDFKYAPPSGYLALCSANLPTPTIIDGSEHFNTVLYTGNGGNLSITSLSFQPDFVWGKIRSTSSFHRLHDVVRGSDNTLASNDTGAEISGNGIVSFDSDGWTMDSGTNINQTFSYAAWAWKAGGTAVSNTDGSITSQVSANVDAGFSVVSYVANNVAGATVGHGLGQEPSLIIQKDRDSTEQWLVYHKSLGATKYLLLNSTNAAATSASAWNNTAPTSAVYSLGAGYFSGNDHIAYCFANSDIIKAGSYTGNGSSDGPFVYTGFRPAWIMVKRSSSGAGTANWVVLDTKRDIYNLAGISLMPNLSNAEFTPASSGYPMDILSNGFKQRGTSVSQNESGSTYIYLAFAENPFKYANAR